jgi:hypothetical protein
VIRDCLSDSYLLVAIAASAASAENNTAKIIASTISDQPQQKADNKANSRNSVSLFITPCIGAHSENEKHARWGDRAGTSKKAGA